MATSIFKSTSTPVTPASLTASWPKPFTPSNIAKPNVVQGNASNMSIVPKDNSIGVRAASPTANISRPPTTLPPAQKASPGSYKGTAITPGNDASIQAQIARIDSTPAPTYPGLIGSLIKNAETTASQGQMTPEEMKARQRLAGIPGLIGSTNANIESHPSDLAFQMGREAVAGRNIESTRQSLAGQVEAYATGRQANTAANTAAGTQYSAAAGYAQPQLGSIGQVPFNPLDSSQGAVLGSTQQGGITGAGQLLGQFQGAQAAGAAGGQTQAAITSTQGQQVAGYQSALQQGQNLQSQLGDLITTFGLNPNDLNKVNTGLQIIARNTSSPQYKILQNYVNDIANTYAQILTPPGGSATDTTRGIAASMLDATASGQSLLAVMQSLDQAAKAKIAGVSTVGSAQAPSAGTIIQTKAGPVNTSW